jgi:hypothetical protein
MGITHDERQEMIVMDIRDERDEQDRKWGEQNHPQVCWVAILAEEFGEWSREVLERDFLAARNELVQVAAVALAAIESIDRNELNAKRAAGEE